MKSKIEKILYDNLFVNILLTIFLTHIFYKISFINRIQGEFLLIEQIKSGSIDSTQFYVESPLFTLIGVLFDINNFDIYLLFVYLITLIFLFLITINLKFLENYSTLFLLTGWVVTVSWFMGHVDILSVLLILLITKITISKNNQELKLLFFYTLLTINHNAIAFVCFFVLLILVEKEQRIRFIIFSFLGQAFGNLLISIYLNTINFSGRGRLRFVFNDNVILDSVNFVSENIFVVVWSGFMGMLILQLVLSITTDWKSNRKFLISLLISLFFTCIALDTSRIFSLSVIPISIYTIDRLKNSKFIRENLSYLYILSFTILFIVGPRYVHGSYLKISPNNEIESFYNFIPRIINSIMSGIWN